MSERICTTPESLKVAAKIISALPAESLPIRITVKKYKPKRSDAQNRRLWVIHGQVSAFLSVAGTVKWTAEEVHEYIFKPQFCGFFETVAGDTIFKRPKSSTELNKMEMAEAQTRYEAWCAHNGIELELEDEAANW